ncbi:MAG: enoyl-CoA hydratase/isomerase family protein [Chloroflexi bacterium]|nr:enoyl-CoA hydratase/isomerase family protein [Chloroflexota bacterium]
MGYETILASKDGTVGTVTLNRPEKLNAYTNKMGAEIVEAFLAFDADPEVRAVVLTGAGRGFCAGLDMAEAAANSQASGSAAARLLAGGRVPLNKVVQEMRKPVIAAVNGVAVGIGFTLPLACDIRIAAEEARIGLIFARAALVPELGSTYRLPRLIGLGRALELCCTGRTVDGKEAERLGLVNRAVPLSKLPETVKELTDQIAECGPLAVALTKKGLYQGSIADLDTAVSFEGITLDTCFKSEDFREYLQSFKEKRKPVFKGR